MAEINLIDLQPQMISKDLQGKLVLLYGDAKVGKTSLAAQIDKVLICGFERGTNALHNVLVQPILKWEDWRKVVRQLVRDKDKLSDKIKCIAIDTVDEAYKLAERYICSKNGIDNLKEIPYGGAYKLLDEEFSSTLRDLAFAGYGIFFISHSKEKTLKNDKGQEYTKIVPALADRPFGIVNKMVDIIAYLRQVDIQEEEDKVVQKRYLFFRGDSRFHAGSRFKYIVPYVELSYDNLITAIYDAIDAEVKEKGGEITTNEVDPYLELNYEDLMEEAKSLWIKLVERGLTEKATEILANIFGKPIKFSEVPEAEIQKLFTALSEIKAIL